jgi:hypothetical protein
MILNWLAIALSGLLLFFFVSGKQLLSAGIVAIAIALLIPAVRKRFTPQLPLLGNPIVLGVLWGLLVIGSFLGVEGTGELDNLVLCDEVTQDQCAKTTYTVFVRNRQSPKFYMVGDAKSVRSQADLKVTLERKAAGRQEVIDTLTVKPKLVSSNGKSRFLLELQPKALPAGEYALAIASSQPRFKPTGRKFAVRDAAIENVILCNSSDRCTKHISAFARDRGTLYASATADQVTTGMPITWSLEYSPEAGKSELLETQTIPAQLQNKLLVLPISPKSLPVGSYELTLKSPQERFEEQTKSFTVWHSEADAVARLDDRLPASTATMGQLNLCDRTGKPKPADLERPIDSQKPQKPKRGIYDRDFCPTNTATLPAGATALGFQLDTSKILVPANLKVTWVHPQSGPEGQSSINELEIDTDGVNYTFSSDRGFPPGDYELILSFETRGSRPIFRKFKLS